MVIPHISTSANQYGEAAQWEENNGKNIMVFSDIVISVEITTVRVKNGHC
jgi:hypothetical protein